MTKTSAPQCRSTHVYASTNCFCYDWSVHLWLTRMYSIIATVMISHYDYDIIYHIRVILMHSSILFKFLQWFPSEMVRTWVMKTKIVPYLILVCFQLTHFSCDDWDNIYTLSYSHHQIGSMKYYPLFMVRSWNNGVRCMSFYILIGIVANFTLNAWYLSLHGA